MKYSLFTKEEAEREGKPRLYFYLSSKYSLRKILQDSFSLVLYFNVEKMNSLIFILAVSQIHDIVLTLTL